LKKTKTNSHPYDRSRAAVRRWGAGCACILASAAAAADPTSADASNDAADARSNAGGLTEIVVTAQRREQRLQDVPISVTAVTDQQIVASGLTQVESLALVTPSFVPGTQIGYGQPYIRGVGSSIVTPGTESSVALYIDGIYQSRNFALESNLINVDRVEVLEGPQGALYGRNATGGVINIVTKTPQEGFDGTIEQSVGNYGLLETKGYVEGGNSTVEASLSGYTRQHTGFYTNLTYGGVHVDRENDYGFAGKVVWHAGAADIVTLGVDFGSTGPDTGAYVNQFGVNNVTAGIFPGAKYTSAPYVTYNNSTNAEPLINWNDTYGINARWRHSFDGVDLTTIGSYRHTRAESSADVDASNINFIYFAQPVDIAQDYSFESNLTSTGAGPFSWLAGVNYFETDSSSNNTVNENTPVVSVFENVVASLKTEAYAAYGQADYVFGPDNKWKASAGLRYTDEHKTIVGLEDVYEGPAAPLPLAEAIPGTGARNWSNVSESASLNYAWTPDINSYLRFTTAFKSGAFNASEPYAVPLDPEKITAYELGTKSDLFSHKLRLDASTFYYDYKDLQVGQINNTGSIIYVNAATAKIYGLEGQGAVQPVDNFEIQLGATWLHARYDQFPAGIALATFPGTVQGLPGNYPPVDLGLPNPNLDGFHMINAPDFSATLGATYTVPLPVGKVGFNVAARYTGNYYFDIDDQLQQKSFTVLNASITFHGPNERYFVRLWGDNLTAAHYLDFESRTQAGDFGNYADPRTYGGTVGFKF
jgi:iron complex outermembrane receptor protein